MLRILSEGEARSQLGDLATAAFLEDVRSELLRHSWLRRVPAGVGSLICLGRALTEVGIGAPGGVLCITGWGTSPQNMELFDGYRRSLGEYRALHDAPIHLFSPSSSKQLECLLDLVLCFGWDCFFFDNTLRCLVKVSHDGYVDVRCADPDGLRSSLAHLEGLDLERCESDWD
jgi:hypothetical protein